MTDPVLERIAYRADGAIHTPIPWAQGLAPVPAVSAATGIPKADVVVVTWTVAEAKALADLLTPGHPVDGWVEFNQDFDTLFKPHLTWKSPAAEAQCQAKFWPTQIGSTSVLCVHSNMHLATDDSTAPVIELWKQLIQMVEPKLIITTGTAGGIGSEVVVGDVLLTNTGKFDCTRMFKNESWAQVAFTGSLDPATLDLTPWTNLVAANAHLLEPETVRSLQLHSAGDVLTCDAFLFDDAEDTYGLRTYDPSAVVEEMDDMTLPLALQQIGSSTPWLVSRCVSDPQMPQMPTREDEVKAAGLIYTKYGYAAALGSVLATYCAITSFR